MRWLPSCLSRACSAPSQEVVSSRHPRSESGASPMDRPATAPESRAFERALLLNLHPQRVNRTRPSVTTGSDARVPLAQPARFVVEMLGQIGAPPWRRMLRQDRDKRRGRETHVSDRPAAHRQPARPSPSRPKAAPNGIQYTSGAALDVLDAFRRVPSVRHNRRKAALTQTTQAFRHEPARRPDRRGGEPLPAGTAQQRASAACPSSRQGPSRRRA